MYDHDHVTDRLVGEVESLKQLVSKLIWTLNERLPSHTTSDDTSIDTSLESCEETNLNGGLYTITIPEDILGMKMEKHDTKTQTIEDQRSDECKMIVATETITSSPEGNKMEPESQQLVLSSSSPSVEDYASILKILRERLERHYKNIKGGIPEQLISELNLFETTHHIRRDPTTSSVWNVSRQEYREVFFGKIGEVIVYREKCVCGEDDCSDDQFCPCNIPSMDDGEETHVQQAAREKKDKEEHEKDLQEKRDKALSSIMAMTGLHDLKAHVQSLCTRADTAKRQGASLKGERFGTMFIGNSGTGKTTAAKHYAKLLYALGVVGSERVKETNAIILCDGGVDRTMRYIQEVCSDEAGVVFIDGAHHFYSPDHYRGKRVLDFMFEEIERQRGRVVIVLAGQEEGMRKVLGHGGDPSGHFPNVINFKDFEDEELRSILYKGLKEKFDGEIGKGKMEIEGGKDGLYMRIAARRLGRGRKTGPGSGRFSNARAVENLSKIIWERQAKRISEKKKKVEEKKKAEEKEKDEKAAQEKTEQLEKDETEDGEKKLKTEPIETQEVANDDENRGDAVSDKKTDHNVEDVPNQEAQPGVEDSNKGEPPGDRLQIDDTKVDEPKQDGASKLEAISDEVKAADKPKEDHEPINNLEDYKLTKEDILGPSPTEEALSSPAWKTLEDLTGMASVKSSILSILSLVKTNYQRELEEKPLLKVSLNCLFLGPPGSGKTLVARLYAQLLTEIGALSKGEVIIRTPSDLIGKYIGHSEANTKAVLNSAMGNVLVIDEAYMMYSGDGEKTGSKTDSFRKGIVDTLVGEIQSEPGEDRCVLLLGYEEPMSEMLQNSNPGLSRRFPLSDAFTFHNFTIRELEGILRSKLKENVLEATEPAIKVAMDVLEKASSRVNFGNGGEVENLISKAKLNYQKRTAMSHGNSTLQQWVFEPEDFDPSYDRDKSAPDNLQALFADVIGCEKVIAKLKQFQKVSRTLKKKNMDPRAFIPTNFVFKGPPGTGKTTTARRIAQVYYEMGFLSEPSVIECSASDLVGKYVGHSGPKTRKLFERAIGKVLFVDEAYRLAIGAGSGSSCGTGTFNSEAVSELVDLLTKPAYQGKLIVILAGYEPEMNKLLDMNPGLASRFPEEVFFKRLDPGECLDVLKMKLRSAGIVSKVLDDREPGMWDKLVLRVRLLARTKGWGNARDMETLAKVIARDVYASDEELDLEGEEGMMSCSGETVIRAFEGMLRERRARSIVKAS